MKKFVLRLDLQDGQDKRRALKSVSSLSGIDEITIDMKGKTLTVIGTVDPIKVVVKLQKKNWDVGLISLGPAKEEPEKKEEGKKKDDETKKEELKEEPKKVDGEKTNEKETTKKEEDDRSQSEQMVERLTLYKQYYPPMNPFIYERHDTEEDSSSSCVIS